MEIKLNFSLISAVLFALMLVGVLYNQLIALAERKGWMEGYTAIAVAIGTAITLIGVAVIAWPAALIALACFVASGSPMLFGSIWRHIQRRAEDQEALRKE